MRPRQGNSPKSRKYSPNIGRRQSDTRRDQQGYVLNQRFQPASSSGGSGGGSPSVNDFRLTLASGFPVYNPRMATPSSTDTTADTCTFASAHGWVTGTMVTPYSTFGNLIAGNLYFIRAMSSTVVQFHSTLADAINNASRVDLTVNVTSQITPSGVENQTLYLSPWTGTTIGLYDGTAWSTLTSGEVSLALGTLTSGKNYDVFASNNAGTLTLELVAWTDDATRATALSRQDGIWVKSTDATRRYVGTMRTISTTAAIDDGGGIITQTGGKRYVYNAANRLPRWLQVYDFTSSWNYSTATWRQANGAATNQVAFVDGLGESDLDVELTAHLDTSSSSAGGSIAIGLDQTTDGFLSGSTVPNPFPTLSSGIFAVDAAMKRNGGAPGYHYLAWLETGNGTATVSWYGKVTGANARLSGLHARVWV
jgi:hypothetical protein